VESPISASTPASPSSQPLVGRLADDRVGSIFQSPVCSTVPAEVNGQRVDPDRMRHRNELDIERPEIDPPSRRHHRHRNFRRIPFGIALGLKQRSAELRRVDRAFQLRPEIDDGAEMIFVGVGQDQADEVLPFFFQKADIGHDEIDARQMLLVAEGYAEINRKPAALVSVAEAIDRQVHADLADAAERRKGQFVRPRHQAAPADAAEPK
jgi:hypothetical protein